MENTTQLIEEIHREFEIAGANLLSQSIEIIRECDKKDMKKGLRLLTLGFSRALQGKEAAENLRVKKEAEKHSRLVLDYSRKYPLNKFITEQQIKTICEKYSLVFGSVELYKGFVPDKNLKQIENFKLRKEDDKPVFSNGITLGEDFSIEKVEITTIIAYRKRHAGYQSNDGITWYGTDTNNLFGRGHLGHERFTVLTGFFICAPLKDMDMTGQELNGYKIQRHIPDPVVLKPVEGGYLIVTAWGDEASDEILVNPINN